MIGALGIMVIVHTVPVMVSAQTTYDIIPANRSSQSKETRTHQPDTSKVTLTMRDSTVQFAVSEIARQSHLLPVYTSGPLFSQRITVHLVNVKAMDALMTVLKGTGLTAKLGPDGETVMIRAQKDDARRGERPAGGIISGHVTDSTSGRGLVGASVQVQGTQLKAVTNDNGDFSFRNVPAGDQVVVVRMFGYRPATRVVTVKDGEPVSVRLMLVRAPTVLSGVVTTATGHQQKLAIGNDITTIDADQAIKTAPVRSISELLETRVPGMTAVHTSGDPGDPVRLRLRGVASLRANNDPIVIVDGVRVYAAQSDARSANLATSRYAGTTYAAPSPLDQIDPNSIESVEVFKGPSATALYGSDAGNGVIVITTKHGKSGDTHWNLALNQGVSYMPGDYQTQIFRYGSPPGAGSQLCGLWSPAPSTQPVCPVSDSVILFQALNDPKYTMLGHGNTSSGSTTISGGASQIQYSLTASASSDFGIIKMPNFLQDAYRQQNGTAPPTWMRRPDNYKKWGVTGATTTSFARSGSITVSASVNKGAQQRSSLESVLAQLAAEPPDVPDTSTLSQFFERVTDDNLTFTSAATVRWQPFTWLPLTGTVGLNTMTRNDESSIPFGSIVDSSGRYSYGAGSSRQETANLGTEVPVQFGSHRPLTVALGVNSSSTSTNDAGLSTEALSPGVTIPTTFIPDSTTVSRSTSDLTTYGWYMEPRFNFSSRFFVTPGFRLDGGSATGSRAGLTAFPKIDASYVMVDRESDPPLFGFLSLFRPRIAVGTAGVQPGPADKLRILKATTGLINGQNVPGLQLFSSQLGNSELRPERSRELEGGADVYLWGSRVQATITGYRKMRYDAIIGLPLPGSLGAGSVLTNIGTVRNAGAEFTLNATVLQTREIGWTVGGSISGNSNTLVNLAPGQKLIGGQTPNGTPQNRFVPGYPLFGWWERPILGYSINHSGPIQESDVIIGDSVVFMGQADPKYNMVLNTSASFFEGRLSVYATANYTNGLTQNQQGAFNAAGLFANLMNDPSTPLATQAAIAAAGRTSSGLIQTVSTLRFSSLSVNYNVPRSLSARWFHVPQMSVAVQGSNLGLHTNYRGKDPNVNAFSTGNFTRDTGQLPEPRFWSLSVNLGN